MLCKRGVNGLSCSSGKKYTEKLKLIIGYDDSPTEYFIGDKKITKIEFAKECMKRSDEVHVNKK